MNKKGFTLTEVLVALAILGMIIISLVQGATVVIRHNASFEHRKIALELAQGVINRISVLPYDSITTESATEKIGPINYQESWNITNITGLGDIKEIEVTVSWSEGTNPNSHSVTLTTFKRST